MQKDETEIAIQICLGLIETTVQKAAQIVKASRCCLDAGDVERAFHVALEIEPLICDANSLLQATSAVRRGGE
jgi:hypothetical protein